MFALVTELGWGALVNTVNDTQEENPGIENGTVHEAVKTSSYPLNYEYLRR
jgi:hypothetical protein